MRSFSGQHWLLEQYRAGLLTTIVMVNNFEAAVLNSPHLSSTSGPGHMLLLRSCFTMGDFVVEEG